MIDRPDIWLNDEELASWRSYGMSSRLLMNALDRQLQRDAGIPYSWFGVLVVLSEQPDRTLVQRDLQSALSFSPSRLSHACGRMVERGWIVRVADDQDRRLICVTLTDQGAQDLDVMARGHARAVRALFLAPLSAVQLAHLRSACSALIKAMPSDLETFLPVR